MIERTINISGKDVLFRSSATVPRLYRAKFKRDIFKDLSKLEKSYKKRKDGGDLPWKSMIWRSSRTWHRPVRNVFDLPGASADQEAQGDNLLTDVASKKNWQRSSREMTTPLFLLRCCGGRDLYTGSRPAYNWYGN